MEAWRNRLLTTYCTKLFADIVQQLAVTRLTVDSKYNHSVFELSFNLCNQTLDYIHQSALLSVWYRRDLMPLDRMTDCVESVLVTVVTSFSLRKQLNQINAYAIERRCVNMLRGPSREYVDLCDGFGTLQHLLVDLSFL
jgi:hypothetical protein